MESPEPTASDPDGDDEHRMPRWVTGFIIAAIAAVVLLVVMLAIGSDGHGPSRHLPDGGGAPTQPSDGHTPPVDHG